MNTLVVWVHNEMHTKYFLDKILWSLQSDSPVLCIDTTGAIYENIIGHISNTSVKDESICLLDLWDRGDMQQWVNILSSTTDELETSRRVEALVSVFVDKFWKKVFWPRIQDYFRHVAAMMIHTSHKPWYTLLQIPRFFSDDLFAKSVASHSLHTVAKSWYYDTYSKMTKKHKKDMSPYFHSKLWRILNDSRSRNILWVRGTDDSILKAIRQKKSVIIHLPHEYLWQETTHFIWSLLVSLFNSITTHDHYHEYLCGVEHLPKKIITKLLKRSSWKETTTVVSYGWHKIWKMLYYVDDIIASSTQAKSLIWSVDSTSLSTVVESISLPELLHSTQSIQNIQSLYDLKLWNKKDLLENDIQSQLHR